MPSITFSLCPPDQVGSDRLPWGSLSFCFHQSHYPIVIGLYISSLPWDYESYEDRNNVSPTLVTRIILEVIHAVEWSSNTHLHFCLTSLLLHKKPGFYLVLAVWGCLALKSWWDPSGMTSGVARESTPSSSAWEAGGLPLHFFTGRWPGTWRPALFEYQRRP